MSLRKIRRIPAFLAALTLAVGLVAHGFGAPVIVIKSAITVVNDMPMSSDMPGKCNDCSNHEKGLAPAACSSVFCGRATASPSIAAVLYVVPAETLSPTDEPDTSGRAVPPDPYPPKATILS